VASINNKITNNQSGRKPLTRASQRTISVPFPTSPSRTISNNDNTSCVIQAGDQPQLSSLPVVSHTSLRRRLAFSRLLTGPLATPLEATIPNAEVTLSISPAGSTGSLLQWLLHSRPQDGAERGRSTGLPSSAFMQHDAAWRSLTSSDQEWLHAQRWLRN